MLEQADWTAVDERRPSVSEGGEANPAGLVLGRPHASEIKVDGQATRFCR
jgi:hypothetical protein